MAQQAQRSTGGGSGGPSPKGVGLGFTGLLLLGAAGLTVNNALFNVDGGHRAIKYTRVGGVKKEIFAEGMPSPRCGDGDGR
jgi:prohibitin 2